MQRFVVTLSYSMMLSFSSGCVPLVLSVVVRNDTPETVWVQSTESKQNVEIAAGRSKEIGHGHGDLIVKTEDNKEFQFKDILLGQISPPYQENTPLFLGPILGRSPCKLNLLLNKNMQMYALIPGKKSVNDKVPQPAGYPKIGQEVHH